MLDPSNCPRVCLVFARCWPAGFAWVKYLLDMLADPLSTLEPATHLLYVSVINMFALASIECMETQCGYLTKRETEDFLLDYWAMKSPLREVRQYAAHSLRTVIETKRGEELGEWLDALRTRFRSMDALVGRAVSRAGTALVDFRWHFELSAHLYVLLSLVKTRNTRPGTAFAIQKRILNTILRVIPTSPVFVRADCTNLAMACTGLVIEIFQHAGLVELAFRKGLVEPLNIAGRAIGALDPLAQKALINSARCRILGAMHRLHCFKAARHDFTRFTQDIGSFSTPPDHAGFKELMDELEVVMLEHTVLRYLNRRGIGLVEEYCSQASYCRSGVHKY